MDEDFLAAYHANYGMYPTQEENQTTSTTSATTANPTSTANTDKPTQPKQVRPSKSSGDEVSVEESLMRAQREAEQGIPTPVLDERLAAADAEHHQKASKRKKEEPSMFEFCHHRGLPNFGEIMHFNRNGR